MLRNYFKIACRNLLNNKFFSLINVFGLATGIAACLLIFFFIDYQSGFDKFHPPGVYRLLEIRQKQETGTRQEIARTMFPMGPTLKSEFPEVADFVRIHSIERVPLQLPGKSAVMATTAGTDASFLRVFNFELIHGDATSALLEPGSIIISERLARQLFGSESPMGKIVRHQGRDTVDYRVTGVLQNMPEQCHLQVDALYSFSTEMISGENGDWENDWLFTYLSLNDGADPKKLEAKFPGYLEAHLGPERAGEYGLFLQPLSESHLWSGTIAQDVPGMRKFSGSYLPVLATVALLVLALAIINYVNLTTARTITRAREIAVRKTSGAGRMQITFQFLGETCLITLMAAVVAVALADVLTPLLNHFTGSNARSRVFSDPSMLLIAGGLALGTGLLSGLVPALSFARIDPLSTLRGRYWNSPRSSIRSTLVIVQFAIAVALSIASVSAFRQLKYMQQYDLGFNKEKVLVSQISWADRYRVQTLMDELRAIPGVQGVTGSLRRMGSPIDPIDVLFQDNGTTHQMRAKSMYVDYNYIPFYHIKLLAGRNISQRYGSDALGNSYVVNESMAKELLELSGHPHAPLSSLIGKPFRYNFQDEFGTIVGITEDFNFNSLHEKVEPLCITFEFDYYFKEVSIRMDSQHSRETLAMIEAKWKSLLPDQQFEYYFLDNYIDQLYQADRQTGQLITGLTLLALLISGLGLIGLATYNTERRTKEIGVRKVLGASVQNIVTMLSRDFIKLVIIGIAIGIPVAWYTVGKWLEGFAYRIDMSWWMFLACALAAIFLALATVSYQSVKTALMNPVDSLRSE